MGILTFEGTVDNGQIKLKDNIRLPDKAKVYVVVPGVEVGQVARIYSPRLARPEQIVDFKMTVSSLDV